MNKTINNQLLKKIILEKIIKESGRFNYNDAYQISWENDCTFELVKEIIDEYIKNEKIKKRYFNPYENLTSNIPIGEDSHEVFIINNKPIKVNELF